MAPAEDESQIAAYFADRGYRTQQTVISGDYGVDVFAENADERLAIQVKMCGTVRRVNRQMVMGLHGVKDYFDCDRAVIATDGELLLDAREVAAKLGIQVLTVPAVRSNFSATEASFVNFGTIADEPSSETSLSGEEASSFDEIWTDHVMPLAGQLLRGKGDRTNIIEKVAWTGVWRTTSAGRSSRIDIVWRCPHSRASATIRAHRATVDSPSSRRPISDGRTRSPELCTVT
ncbi:restriction endonuclease [Arthrobacter koreensis]|uniref:restriction endonuclease n=1 Tax=Arthrobacter koreensis TaxID=199136 RepID=UPI000ABB2646